MIISTTYFRQHLEDVLKVVAAIESEFSMVYTLDPDMVKKYSKLINMEAL